ncbi:MAG: peptidylprolyl isomerase [Planctomycetes bacterium]|nr:peptidylprolyl isomerase [Planctomycetota bacterium]
MFGNVGFRLGWGVLLVVLLLSCGCEGLRDDLAGRDEKVCVLETSMGEMVFGFFAGEAPQTCANFQRLVGEGFYDGKDFYRVVQGHVIQAGGGGKTVPAEFNEHKHVFGTLGLGRTGGPDSGNSEIYICLAERTHLDGKYTAFGQLIEGAAVLESIANVEVEEIFRGTLALHKPLEPIVILKARIQQR